MRGIKIGARGSRLSMIQVGRVAERFRQLYPELEMEIVTMKTLGDQHRETPLDDLGDRGIFTSRIELALLAGEIDVAVHSLKDLPPETPPEITLCVPERADPADALICPEGFKLEELPHGATVLTGSARRRALLKHHRPDLKTEGIRGNVPTRLRKINELDADALVLAVAGLDRLNLTDQITQRLCPQKFIPAPGQGAIGVQTRSTEGELTELCGAINHPELELSVSAERAFLYALGGGCHVPAGAYGLFEDGMLSLSGFVAETDGTNFSSYSITENIGTLEEARNVGKELALKLRESGL
jgi:hydroxymethylbilane synthase